MDRPAIVGEGIARGAAIVGRELSAAEIFVVGDTPLDIEAAHAAGCAVISVATGHFDSAALRAAGADHVLETLEEELPIA
jgi:phosphoglycolate phosphatase-like HAD superfamily hydrolase